MPQQKLTENSLLLTQHGWLDVSEHSAGGSVIGVDRLGRLSQRPATASSIGTVDSVVYVGSGQSFGQFHPKSVLMDSDGRTKTALEIAENNLVGEWQFENVVCWDGCCPNDVVVGNLWRHLEMRAIVKGACQLALTARGYLDQKRSSFRFLSNMTAPELASSSVSFLILDLQEFHEAMKRSWQETIKVIVDAVFEEKEDGVIAIDREMAILCIWRQLAEHTSAGRGAELQYDSLQDSTMILMNFAQAGSGMGLSRGGTAFLRKRPKQSYRLNWDDSSWSPIASGFILPPG